MNPSYPTAVFHSFILLKAKLAPRTRLGTGLLILTTYLSCQQLVSARQHSVVPRHLVDTLSTGNQNVQAPCCRQARFGVYDSWQNHKLQSESHMAS